MEYWEAEGLAPAFLKAHRGRALRVKGGLVQCVGKTELVIIPSGPVVEIPEQLTENRKLRVFPTLHGRVKTNKTTWIHGEGSGLDGYAARRGEREGLVFGQITYGELCGLLQDWEEWSKTRRFMTVTGHYAAMLVEPGITFVGARLAGEIVAAYGFSGKVVCWLKHKPGLNWAAGAVWTHCLEELGPGVNCGETADGLKKRLGLTPVRLLRAEIKPGAFSEEIDLGDFLRMDQWREAAVCAKLRAIEPGLTWDRYNPPPRLEPGDTEVAHGQHGSGDCLDLNFDKSTLLSLIKGEDMLRAWSSGYRVVVYTDSAKSKYHLNRDAYLRHTNGGVGSWDEYKMFVSNFWHELGLELVHAEEHTRAVKFYLRRFTF